MVNKREFSPLINAPSQIRDSNPKIKALIHELQLALEFRAPNHTNP
jgi:hypothetical protein